MWYICGILTWKETLQSMKQNKNESKGIYAFANKIYELRNEKQMDYFELSRITGINDVEYLSKLESASIINPSAGKIIRIGQALEADIFELLSLAKNREENEGIQLRIEVDNRTISFILNRTVCKQSLNLQLGFQRKLKVLKVWQNSFGYIRKGK